MGRPEAERSTVLFAFFDSNQDSFVSGSKVLPPSNDVYGWFRKKLQRKGFEISEKGIYSAAVRWFARKSIVEPSPIKAETDFDMSTSTNDESTLNSSVERSAEIIRFSIKLKHTVWKTIEPVEINYRRNHTVKGVRTYKVLQPGVWSNVIVDAIASKKDVPCAWVFKTNKCYADKVKFSAVCVTCSANLFGTVDHLPDGNEPVTVKIELHGVNERRHKMETNRNVKIVGKKAEDIAASG